MIRNAFAAALVSAALFLCISCSGGSTPAEKKSRLGPAGPDLGHLHQPALDAARSRASLRCACFFTNDVIPEAKVNGDASANIRITPAVKAKATFAQPPRNRAAAGNGVRAGHGIQDRSARNGPHGRAGGHEAFEFLVTTLGINFDVHTHGLDVEYDRNELMTLSGHVQTADTESREKVEKIVSATLNGKPVPVTWTPGERYFGFAIADIVSGPRTSRS